MSEIKDQNISQTIQEPHKKYLPVKIWLPIVLVAAVVVGYLSLAGTNSWWPYQGRNDNSFSLIPVRHEDSTATWQTYRNEEYGFEVKYPSELKINENNGSITLSHSIPYENHGDCDMVGGDKTFKDLIDFKVSFLITKNPDMPGYTDGNYKSGQLKGIYSYLGAEGCGEIGYYFPAPDNKTLVIKKDAVQALLGLSTIWNLDEILKVPGVISKEESQKIFNQILSTFKFIEPTSESGEGEFCIQVITPARNLQTGEIRDFPTPCDVPDGWEQI